jgi:hypothetical protein
MFKGIPPWVLCAFVTLHPLYGSLPLVIIHPIKTTPLSRMSNPGLRGAAI